MKITVSFLFIFFVYSVVHFSHDLPINASLPANSLGEVVTESLDRDAAVHEEGFDEKERLKKILTRQAEAWNRGDLQSFMQTYWKSDELTFSSGGTTTRGWQATLDNYKKGYAPPKEMGQLNFDQLEISLLNPNAALILGDWHLTMDEGDDRDGNFSLVVKKVDGQWKIIHDHSSSLGTEDDSD